MTIHIEKSPAFQTALLLARHGLKVVQLHYPTKYGCSCPYHQCESIGKHPMINGWRESATNDAE